MLFKDLDFIVYGFLGYAIGFMNLPIMDERKFLKGDVMG